MFWFVAASVLFTVFMYGVAETLAARIPSQEEYIGATPAVAILPFFFAGALFPIHVLPGALAAFAKVLPLTHALALMRYGFVDHRGTGLHDIWGMSNTTTEAWLSLGVVVLFAAAFIALGIRTVQALGGQLSRLPRRAPTPSTALQHTSATHRVVQSLSNHRYGAHMIDMHNKTVVVTGANSGVGFVTAKQLAEAGAEIVMVCRDPERGETARAPIAEIATGPPPQLFIADLSSQDDIRDAGQRHPPRA